MAVFVVFTISTSWFEAREVVDRFHTLSASSPARRDRTCCWQIRSTAAACMSNIAEGFGRLLTGDFERVLEITLGSACVELSRIFVGLFQHDINVSTFDELHAVIGRLTGEPRGLRTYLQNQRDR